MPEVPEQLLGRDTAGNLLGALIKRPLASGVPGSRRQSVLVFEGTRGDGKTALVKWLAGRLDQHVPYALLDFETNQQVTVPEVLSALAFELGNHCPNYPHLQFPLLLGGLVVMRAPLTLGKHSVARAEVAELLGQQHGLDYLRGILRAVAANVAVIVREKTGVQVEEAVGALVDDVIVPGLPRFRPAQRIMLGSGLSWYGHRGQGRTKDPIDELIALNRWAQNVTNAVDANDKQQNQQQIDELLLDAFLTDLHDEFAKARHPKRLVANCVILLDNVDTGLGRHFLGELVSARRQRAVGQRIEPEPLTVVSTSRGDLLDGAPGLELVEVTDDLEPVEERLDRPGGRPPHWLRYRLPDLDRDEVRAMVNALALGQSTNPLLTELVWGLAEGHPATTDLLVQAIAVRPEHRDEPARVLYEPEPDEHAHERLPAGERALLDLTGDFPQDGWTDLITCSAAATHEDAVRLATEDERLPDGTPLLAGNTAKYLAIVDPVLWPASAGAGPAVLRRLLLGNLARRGTDPPPKGIRPPEWAEVFGWYRDRCAAAKDEPAELYYALANGEVAAVARALLRRLTEDPAPAWLALLDSVVRAPLRTHYVAAPKDTPSEELDALIGDTTDEDELLITMRGLVAGLHILSSPFTGSHRKSVHLEVAADYDRLAPKAASGRELLFARAQEHRRDAESWR